MPIASGLGLLSLRPRLLRSASRFGLSEVRFVALASRHTRSYRFDLESIVVNWRRGYHAIVVVLTYRSSLRGTQSMLLCSEDALDEVPLIVYHNVGL